MKLFLYLLVPIFFSCSTAEIPIVETGSQNPMPDAWIDSETGHKIIKLTRQGNENRSFYFHNNPFIPSKGNTGDIMIYYGSNNQLQYDNIYKGNEIKQLFALNLKTLESKQLTNSKTPIRGEIVAKKRREVFYQSKDSIFGVNVDNAISRLVFVFPETMKRAGVSTLNADENLLAGTFSDPLKDTLLKNNPRKGDYFNLIFEAKLPHTLFTIQIETGEIEYIHRDTAWINHVQFSPSDKDLLMFCHEGPWHLLDRIWTIDVIEKKPKLMHYRSIDNEIAGHEFFSRDGKKIWFDLQIPKGETFYLASVDIKTGVEKRYGMKRDEWSIHFTISPDQKIFAGDGGDPGQVAKARDGQWIYLFHTKEDSLSSEKLVNMKNHNYDLEPNVHFTPNQKWIVLRANFEGTSQIYAVEIEKNRISSFVKK